ncbi:S8 family serine peptidase [Ahniella affigens]|nr:S8 family serine peptidase [Ahniella affigens]
MSNQRYRKSTLAAALAACGLVVSSGVMAQAKVYMDGLQDQSQHERFIIKYRDGSKSARNEQSLQAALNQASRGMLAKSAAPAFSLKKSRRLATGAELISASRGLDTMDAQNLMVELAKNGDVEYVEIDRLMGIALTPNDTRYAEQWHYKTSAVGANVASAWDKNTGAGVVVAVVDSGKLSHSDLNANLLAGYDFVASTTTGNGGSGDGNGRDSDPTDAANVKHGNHVAGTIAAVTNNSAGVAGVAFSAKVVPIRVLGNGGYGATSDIADGIIWASGGTVSGVPANANPAEVINLSLGGAGSCSATYQNAVTTATNNGSIVVVASGNSNMNVSGFTPANCTNAIAVAASDLNGNRAWYSNYGTGIHITAPGGETCSPSVEFLALGESTTGKCTQNHASNGVLSTTTSGTYEFYQGTSMASPHVAGIVALIQSVSATPKTVAQIKTLLSSTARPITSAKCPGGCGPGLIDANAAVTAAQGGGGGGSTQTYTNGTDVNITDNSTVNSTIVVSGRSGNASATSSVAVDIRHTYQGDLVVDLIAPDGTVYNLHNRTGASTDNIITTYSRNLSSEVLNGTWTLRVKDQGAGDVGYINSFSLTF